LSSGLVLLALCHEVNSLGQVGSGLEGCFSDSGVPCCEALVALRFWFEDNVLMLFLLVFSFLFGLVGACSPRLLIYFVLHGGCPCTCLWDSIPFLGLASVGENVPLHSLFEFACKFLQATNLYRKLALLFFILIYSYI